MGVLKIVTDDSSDAEGSYPLPDSSPHLEAFKLDQAKQHDMWSGGQQVLGEEDERYSNAMCRAHSADS